MDFQQVPSPDVTQEMSMKPKVDVRLVVIVILVVLTSAVLTILFMRRNVAPSQVREELVAMIDGQCETGECAFILTSNKAIDSRNVGVCDAVPLEDGLYEECVREYAYSLLDASACEALRGEARFTCANSVYHNQALRDQDIAYCMKIEDADLRKTCGFDLVHFYAQTDNCENAGEFQGACGQIIDKERTIAAEVGPELCDPYIAMSEDDSESEEYGICLSVLDTVDLDGDGLTIREEIEVGTDNQNPDTDGDGFDDGTEIRSGYNPLGE